MACYHPLPAWKVFRGAAKKQMPDPMPLAVPCGRCIGCRIQHAKDWAIRMTHEAQMHQDNSFITLTYSDENLPADGGLRVKDWQDFAKRLRKNTGAEIRFYHCGEYGEKNLRPHYHAILFGYRFPDERLRVPGQPVYGSVSALLQDTWGLGHTMAGTVNWDSISYVARYVTKKLGGAKARERYDRVDTSTGEVVSVRSDYATMSRRPGIARSWIETFVDDVYPSDFVVVNGRPMKPPRYYDDYVALHRPDLWEGVKEKRMKEFNPKDETTERRAVREFCTTARHNLKTRNIEQ